MISGTSFKRFSSTSAGARRVVVTGLGVVSPVGVGQESFWQNLINGKSGTSQLTNFDCSKLPSRVAAYVPRGQGEGQLCVEKQIPDSKLVDVRRMSTFVQYALVAATEAMRDANYFPQTEEEKERTGVAVGSGIGSIEDIVETHELLKSDAYRKISPFFIPRILVNIPSGTISMAFSLKGPNHACSTACATGAHSIGDASRLIQHGDADVMIAGGTEACINPVAVAGFCRAKALSGAFNDTPEAASRPFEKSRDGFVIGEGAGIVVLEELEHALKRNAKIYAEVRGYGLAGDAHHITAPPDNGEGAARAMRNALRNARLRPEDVSYINAHGTSTPLGDAAEVRAVCNVFGDHANSLAISSTKGSVGHLLGAAGAVEAIASVLALQHGVAPPTINLKERDPELPALNYVANEAQKRDMAAVLSNSFGFGGTNACLVFTKPDFKV